MKRAWAVVALGLLVTAGGCGRRSDELPPVRGPARVKVMNNARQAMEVLIVGSGITHRLGSVNPGMDAWFNVPETLVGNAPVEFLAHPVADRRQVVRTGQLQLAPGRIVDFIIDATLFNSTATIRP